MKEENVTIDGKEYIKKTFSNRLCTLTPVDRKPLIRSSSQKLRKNLVNAGRISCQVCGSKKNLDAHHKKPVEYIRLGKNYRKRPPNDDASVENGMLLCRSCHLKEHRSTSR